MKAPIIAEAAIADELQRRLMARPVGKYMPPLLPRVVCADGFAVSVQASYGHYSTPRENAGPWYAVELGYPTAPMPSLARYCDCADDLAETATDTVWGYVPLISVAQVLASHGGLLPEEPA